MPVDRWDIVTVLGMAAMLAGLALIFWPAALVAVGAMLMTIGIVGSR